MSLLDTKRNLDTVLVELIEELRHNNATHTEMVGQLRGLIANDVLLVATYAIPSSGYLTYDFPAPFGAVQVSNHSASNTVTVSADPPQGTAPTGRGAYRVGAGKGPTIGLHGKALTIYGTAGDTVSFQVFTRAWPPSGG